MSTSSNGITWTTIQKLDPVNAHEISYPFAREQRYTLDPVVAIRSEYENAVNKPRSRVPVSDNVMLYQGSETDVTQLFPIGNGFFSAISEAWATHGNIVLSPDDVWIAIQLQFCRYMEANAEALRYTFVDHEGQEELSIDMTDCATATNRYDWATFMGRMMSRIQDKVKNDVADDFLPHFSTTTPLQTSLKHLAVMDSMQRYFAYKMTLMCGIEKVGFLGTLDDWNMLRLKANGLKKFHINDKSGYFPSLREWVDDLLIIIDQFIQTYQGKVDVEFWNKVMSKEYVGAGSGGSMWIDGWLLTFLVGQYKEKCDVADIKSLRFNVPVDVNDNCYEFKVRVLGGFTGVIRDATTNTYYPQHSLAVVRVNENAAASS